VITGDPVPLEAAIEAHLLRVVQEALTNVRRHAAASEVTVTLSYVDDGVVIDVADNGIGIDGAPPGVGLTGMRERMDAIGGTLTVESAPGEGTTVALSVPVP
jgi:signal transduction histidine kinase